MGVIIKAVTDGFRRGGIAHRSAGTFYPDGQFTEEQLEQFRKEPQLVVIEQAEPFSNAGLDDERLEEMGNTITSLEFQLGVANDQYDAASVLLAAFNDQRLAAPALIVADALALEPADPTAEGVICIAGDALLSLISQHLQPVPACAEAPDDENDSTLNGPASGAETPSVSASTAPVSPEPGSGSDVVKGGKSTGKRGSEKEADK